MITLNQPVPRGTVTKAHLAGFTADLDLKIIVCFIRFTTNNDDETVQVIRMEFTEGSNPSFQDFVAGVNSAPVFKRDIENYLITLPAFAGVRS